MKALKKSIAIALALCLCIGSFTIRAIASEDMPNIHVYAPSGDDPSTPDNESPDVESSKYQVKVNGVAVPAIKYNQNGTNMDIARFASDSKTPEYEVSLINGETISSIQVYPSHYYPAESMAISADKKSVKFSMSEKLSYAIVYINGTPSDQNGKPYLALINDPLEAESEKPVKTASNVLDFKAFSTQYLLEHPINDVVGEVCLVGGTVQDYSNNDSKLYTLSYPEGVFVDYDSNQVTFPNKRARKANDVSDALQAALQKIKEDPALDTLYIPSGCYLWSGLRIEDWNGDVSNGGKPLIIYTEEGALLENRLSECKEAMEPAIWIKNSSFVTISGRGMHDGKGLINTDKDKKDARNTPHQGGSMLLSSQNIVFNDTYVRDVKQWNWECHTVENIEYNNIKGLSPYNHAWVDGLDLTSGKNVTVNGAITLGNDDCFASGHYNPSNEFPARSIKEDKFTETIGAAAYYYNRDRMSWDTADSENIVVKNSLHWTLGAGNGLRTGHNAFGYALKSYHFENFNVMNFTAGGWGITIQANSPYSKYEEFTFKDCYFNTDRVNGNIKINGNASDTIESVEMDNVVFTKSANYDISNIDELVFTDLSVAGKAIAKAADVSMTTSNVDSLIFNLTVTVPVDKSALSDLSSESEKLEKGNYTDQSWTAFLEKLAVAKTVLDDPDATQEDVDNAVAALKDSKDSLVSDVPTKDFKLYAMADTYVSSWNNDDQNKNYGANPYLRVMRMTNATGQDNYGYLGELYTGGGGSGNDGKISFLKFDISEFKKEDILGAALILTYYGRARNTYTGNDTVKVALVPNDWIEGNGLSTVSPHSNGDIADSVTWKTMPPFSTLTDQVMESPEFQVDKIGQVKNDSGYDKNGVVDGSIVEVDVSDLIAELPEGEDFISLAFCETKNFDLLFVSVQGYGIGNNITEAMQPTLKLSIAQPQATVTFDSKGGTEVSSVAVIQGNTLSQLPVPEKEGLEFGGWFKDEAFDSEFTSETAISESLTVYAKWIATLSFDPKGGTAVDSVKVLEGESLDTLPVSTKDGLALGCWRLDETLELALTTPIEKSATAYAEWLATVTFDSNGGTDVAQLTVKEGELLTIPEVAQTGYRFDGWFLEPEFTSLFAPETPIAKSLGLCAKWTQLFVITASASPNGAIFPSNEITLALGESQTFDITPDDGFLISDVLVDQKSVGAVSSYTFENLESDHAIHAEFERIPEPVAPKILSVSLNPASATTTAGLQVAIEVELENVEDGVEVLAELLDSNGIPAQPAVAASGFASSSKASLLLDIAADLEAGTYLVKVSIGSVSETKEFAVSGAGTEPDPEDPGTEPEEPGTDPEDPGTESEDPGTDPEEPGTDPEEPGTDPEEPGTDPEDPGTDPEEPGTDPEDPGTDPEEPGTDPEEPGTDPEEPGTDPEEPGTDPEDSGTDPEEPGTDPEDPGTDPEDPGTDPIIDPPYTPPYYYYPPVVTPAAKTPTPAPKAPLSATEKAEVVKLGYAQELNKLGLFVGTGTDEAGKPTFELDKDVSRLQALAIVLRLMGLEEKALAFQGSNPFVDVPDWGDRYAAYASSIGLTVGIDDARTLFAPERKATYQEFTAFMLRILQYFEANGDFSYERSIEAGARAGLYPDGAPNGKAEVLRGSAVETMVNSLFAKIKATDRRLIDKLILDGALSKEAAQSFEKAVADLRG